MLSGALLSRLDMFPIPLRQELFFGGFFFCIFAFFEIHTFSSFRAKRIQSKLDKVEARLSSTCRGRFPVTRLGSVPISKQWPQLWNTLGESGQVLSLLGVLLM